jgi:hypothetical protein
MFPYKYRPWSCIQNLFRLVRDPKEDWLTDGRKILCLTWRRVHWKSYTLYNIFYAMFPYKYRPWSCIQSLFRINHHPKKVWLTDWRRFSVFSLKNSPLEVVWCGSPHLLVGPVVPLVPGTGNPTSLYLHTVHMHNHRYPRWIPLCWLISALICFGDSSKQRWFSVKIYQVKQKPGILCKNSNQSIKKRLRPWSMHNR